MSQTFACPHCTAKYPIKPALVGRNLRCTSCKNAFQLQENGTALKVKSRSDSLRTDATDEDTKRHTAENLRSTKDRIADEEKANQAREKAAQVKRERLRQAMAATLSKSAADALEVESSKEETRKHERSRASQSRAKQQEGTLKSMSVVLTGQAKQQQRYRRGMLAATLGVMLLSTIVYFGFTRASAQVRALRYFTEYPIQERQQYPERLRSYLEKMWYVSLPYQSTLQAVIIDIDKAEFTSAVEELSSEGAAAYFSQFNDMKHMYLSEHWLASEAEQQELKKLIEEDPLTYTGVVRPLPDLWVAKNEVETARALWWANGGTLANGFQLAGQLLAQQKKVIETRAIPNEMRKVVQDPVAAHILGHLFVAETDFSGAQRWQKEMLNGSIPAQLRIQRFRGVGSLLSDTGANNELVYNISYSGILLQCDGLGEPDVRGNDWRIFEIIAQR